MTDTGPNPPDAQWPGGAQDAGVTFVLNYGRRRRELYSCMAMPRPRPFLSEYTGGERLGPGQRHWGTWKIDSMTMARVQGSGVCTGLFTGRSIPSSRSLRLYASALARSPNRVEAMKTAGGNRHHGLKLGSDHRDCRRSRTRGTDCRSDPSHNRGCRGTVRSAGIRGAVFFREHRRLSQKRSGFRADQWTSY